MIDRNLKKPNSKGKLGHNDMYKPRFNKMQKTAISVYMMIFLLSGTGTAQAKEISKVQKAKTAITDFFNRDSKQKPAPFLFFPQSEYSPGENAVRWAASKVDKRTMMKVVERISSSFYKNINLSPNDLTKEEKQRILSGIIYGIDDNLLFGCGQALSGKNQNKYNNDYWFVKSKSYTDAVFIASYGVAVFGTAAAAAQALIDSGAAGAFAVATSPTGVGGIVGGTVAVEELARAGVLAATSKVTGDMYNRSSKILSNDTEILRGIEIPKKVILKNIDNNFLDQMEQLGGHTIAKHISKTDQELIKRSIKEDVDATAFTNKAVAYKAIKENLSKNSVEIEKWLNNPKSRYSEVFYCDHSFIIGKGVQKGSKSVARELKTSRIVLNKSNKGELNLIIKTAFPEF